VPQIRVGGRLFTNLDAIEAEALPNGPAVASVLGRDFLRQFVMIINYPGRTMVLLDPAVPDVEAEAMGCKGTGVPFAMGDCVVAQGIGRGTQQGVFRSPAGELAPSGRAMQVHFCDVYRLKDGKIVRAYSYFDFYGLLLQLAPEARRAA
jgi:hypothetical protein